MATSNDGHIKTNAPWQLKSKNASKRRDTVTEQRNPDNVGSKNKGSTNKEAPHQTTANKNPSVPNKDFPDARIPQASRTQGKAHNAPKGSSDLFGEKSVNSGAKSKNASSRDEHPIPQISSGKTKVHNYPKGRNRGRNFKS